MATDIFQDNGFIAGVFNSADDEILFLINGGDDDPGTMYLDGFLIDSYRLDWQRPIQYRRAFNVRGKLAQMGYGTGTLTLQGVVGPAEEFEKLVKAASGQDLCQTAACAISVSGDFAQCAEDGSGTINSETRSGVLTASGLILQGINMGATLQEGAVTLTQASMQFKVAGVSID